MRYFAENFCDECDAVLDAVFDDERFWSFEVGRIKCAECGYVNVPCNECFGTDIKNVYGCLNCPWATAAVTTSMPKVGCSKQKGTSFAAMPVPYRIVEA